MVSLSNENVRGAPSVSGAHSYRGDEAVPWFDDTQPLVIFDGHCALCSSGVLWMLARDPHGTSRFAVIQDPLPRALYAHYGLDADAFDTFMVLTDGVPHLRWRGVVAAGRTLPRPWRWLATAASLVPAVIGDRIYDFVQRNRIAWFGGRDACLRPDAELAKRFLG